MAAPQTFVSFIELTWGNTELTFISSFSAETSNAAAQLVGGISGDRGMFGTAQFKYGYNFTFTMPLSTLEEYQLNINDIDSVTSEDNAQLTMKFGRPGANGDIVYDQGGKIYSGAVFQSANETISEGAVAQVVFTGLATSMRQI